MFTSVGQKHRTNIRGGKFEIIPLIEWWHENRHMTVKHKDNEINFTSTNDSVTSNVSIEMANFLGDFLFIFS